MNDEEDLQELWLLGIVFDCVKERREKAKTVATLLEERVADTLVFDLDKLKEDVGNYGIGEGFAKMHKHIFEQMIQLLESNHLTNQ